MGNGSLSRGKKPVCGLDHPPIRGRLPTDNIRNTIQSAATNKGQLLPFVLITAR